MNPQYFVNNYLVKLANPDDPDRAALADLRRGLRDFPDLSSWMHRHIRPRMPADIGWWGERTHYLTAALFATHKRNIDKGNLGTHFRGLLTQNAEADSPIERRFTYLLAAHPEDLHFHLRQSIAFLSSKEIAVNWVQLMWDIAKWNNPDSRARVQESWASSFWQTRQPDTNTTETIKQN